jgi:hypothetical protein
VSKPKKTRALYKPSLIDDVDLKLAWLFIALIAVLPLLIRAKEIAFVAPLIIAPIVNTGLHNDIFSYYKWILLLGLAGIGLIFLLFKILAGSYQLRVSYLNIPLFLLTILVIISTVTSEYKSIALFGLYDQKEGTLTYLAYFALVFVAANTVFKEWLGKYLTLALGIFTCINVVIILFNFYGHDLLRTPVMQSLILPSSFTGYVSGILVSTLSNPNYVSGLAAALFAFFITFALLKHGWRQRLLYIVLATASFIMILASLSSSGFISIVIVSPVIAAVTFLSRERKQTIITAAITTAVCLAVFCVMNAHNPGIADQTINSLKQSQKMNYLPMQTRVALNSAIHDIGADSGNEKLTTRTKTPSRGSETARTLAQDTFSLPASAMSGLSGRLYIWKETIKLIEVRPLSGYGLDTLAYHFPHNDINMIAGMGSYGNIITKPHNIYLGIAYGSGIPAMLALLALFLLHIYHTGRRLWLAERSENLALPAAIFLFFCAFAVQWLVNDSVIGSSAIFWTLLGIGVSLNNE